MRYSGFQHWQTSSNNLILQRGKVGCLVLSNRANCEFIHGCIFIQWINFGPVAVAKILTFLKSFEFGSYSNTKNTSTTNPSIKTISKIYPLDKSTAFEGVFENISQWVNVNNETSNQPGGINGIALFCG